MSSNKLFSIGVDNKMLAGIGSISNSAVSLLFSHTSSILVQKPLDTAKLLDPAPGHTDDVMKAGNAIGKIIEIVAGMKASSAVDDSHMFSMEGATRTDNANGGYTLVKTGIGAVVTEDELIRRGVEMTQRHAVGIGPAADKARAYIKAVADGTLTVTNLDQYGVKVKMTETVYYYADGRERGGTGSYQVTGLDEFKSQYTFIGEDGYMRDLATGKYSSFNQNGTVFSYNVF